jgi:hypothetical protein
MFKGAHNPPTRQTSPQVLRAGGSELAARGQDFDPIGGAARDGLDRQ